MKLSHSLTIILPIYFHYLNTKIKHHIVKKDINKFDNKSINTFNNNKLPNIENIYQNSNNVNDFVIKITDQISENIDNNFQKKQICLEY